MKKLLCTILLAVLPSCFLALDVPDSSKAAALGETAYLKNEFSLFANPALNYRLKDLRLKFNLLSCDSNFYSTANLGFNLGDNTGLAFGGAFTKNAAYGISLSKKIDFLAFGVNARYLAKKYLDTVSGSAFDIGIAAELKDMPSFAPDKILFSVNNLGDTTDLLGDGPSVASTKFGVNFSKLGIGLDAAFGTEFKASVSWDYNMEIINIRAGAIFDKNVRFCGGLGLLMGEDELCYSFSIQPNGTLMHQLSLSVELTPSKTTIDNKNKELFEVDLKGNIKDYNTQAMEYFQAGHLSEAIALWKKVLQLDKANDFAQKYIQEAKEVLQLKIETAKKTGEEADKTEKWDKAIASYETLQNILPEEKQFSEKIISIKSRLIEAYNGGKIYFDDKQYIKAIEKWQWLLERHPSYSDTEELIKNAQTELKKGSQEKDLLNKYFKEAVEANTKGNLALAVDKLNKILVMDSTYEPAITFLASLVKENFDAGLKYYGQNQYEKAMAEWKKVLNLDPANEKAKFYINEAEQQIKDKITKYFREGIESYNAGEYLKAIDSWKQGLSTDPSHKEMNEYIVKAMISQGILLYRQDKLREAVSYWENANKINPNEEKIALYLKRAKNKIKMLEELEKK
ncbi:MAG: hypothetical protein A2231_00600 [Candidatus Firestonebacteria bacterium RIFOXYA2_FULL_40_8]|nr:MAG: hypothetical protein A2231_00600 [Candidatus Firestonebacteria bacterium RIFOXYA2_FULL_40_8]